MSTQQGPTGASPPSHCRQLAADAERDSLGQVCAVGLGCGKIDVDMVAVRVPDIDLDDRHAWHEGDLEPLALRFQPRREFLQVAGLEGEMLEREVAALVSHLVYGVEMDRRQP